MTRNTINVTWQHGRIIKKDKWRLNGHKSALIWLTGLPSSGKSTIANELDCYLHENKIRSVVLDGDNLRRGLNRDLGFSVEDRRENLRRVGEVAKLFVHAGIMTIAAFVSPFKSDRRKVRQLLNGEFIEAFVKCDLCVCEERDPKGLYKRARNGEIPHFTGISDPYEPPENPELVLVNDTRSVEENVKIIVSYLSDKGLIMNGLTF
jgi:adenylylsulfate kinase